MRYVGIVPLHIGARLDGHVRQAIVAVEGDDEAIGSGDTLPAAHLNGLVVKVDAEWFHLPTGEDGASSSIEGALVGNDNDWTALGMDESTSRADLLP